MRGRNLNEKPSSELQDPHVATAYLEESLDDGRGEFLIALREYVNVHSSIAVCAENVGVTREALYRMLSKTGNPEFESLTAILAACNLKIRFATDDSVMWAA
jgi:probable addiction module antidote protein